MLGGSQNYLLRFGSYIAENCTPKSATGLCSENSGCQTLAAEPHPWSLAVADSLVLLV